MSRCRGQLWLRQSKAWTILNMRENFWFRSADCKSDCESLKSHVDEHAQELERFQLQLLQWQTNLEHSQTVECFYLRNKIELMQNGYVNLKRRSTTLAASLSTHLEESKYEIVSGTWIKDWGNSERTKWEIKWVATIPKTRDTRRWM